jgi:hypothetical protein
MAFKSFQRFVRQLSFEIYQLASLHIICTLHELILGLIKTQWEQLSSSRSHSSPVNFSTFNVRLRLSGWLFRPDPLAFAFTICFNNLWLSGSAYYSITFKLSIRYSFRFTFPDGAFFRLRMLQPSFR